MVRKLDTSFSLSLSLSYQKSVSKVGLLYEKLVFETPSPPIQSKFSATSTDCIPAVPTSALDAFPPPP